MFADLQLGVKRGTPCQTTTQAAFRPPEQNNSHLIAFPFQLSSKVFVTSCIILTLTGQNKGRMAPPKRMNFRKNSKRPLTPPPSFSENYVADFATKVRDFATKVRMFILAGLLNII